MKALGDKGTSKELAEQMIAAILKDVTNNAAAGADAKSGGKTAEEIKQEKQNEENNK